MVYFPGTMESLPNTRKRTPEYEHRCDTCGYIIPDIQMTLVRFDFGCPRCTNSFANFTPVLIKEDDK